VAKQNFQIASYANYGVQDGLYFDVCGGCGDGAFEMVLLLWLDRTDITF
jgi:hypothetical protein